jgi:hypothetical protein
MDLDQKELDGFQFGKAVALRDWQVARERRDFEALCNRLRVKKWRREVYGEGGTKLERLRANHRKYAAQPRVKSRQAELGRAKRRAAYRANPTVCTCLQCGATWCPFQNGGVRPREIPKFCSSACAQVHRYHRKRVATKRCSACGEVGHTRKRCSAQWPAPSTLKGNP